MRVATLTTVWMTAFLTTLLATDPVAAQEAADPLADAESVESVDFEAEEQASDQQKAQMVAAAGGSGGGMGAGLKLFVDLLVDHRIGEEKFQFRPNHTFVFLQANVYDDVQFMMHISDDPVFFELTYNVTPRLALKIGKLLVPFGTNEFHHLIGGRVDELSSFLPETWVDYGVSLSHVAYDGENAAVEYVLYALNGFSGAEAPNIAEGSATDNNWSKALGARLRVTLFDKLKVTGSLYGDVWDVEDKYPMIFYSLGAELSEGTFPVAGLERLRLRGEWSRGEVRLPVGNYQHGLMLHAFARTGYFAEAQLGLGGGLAARVRAGRVNPDNRVTDDGDLEVYEPALLIGVGSKLWWTLAYQLTTGPGFDYDSERPADIVYAKMFLVF